MRNGSVQSETLFISPDGGEVAESVKTYDPGTITISRPAQNNTFGSYHILVGSGFSLLMEAYESEVMGYAGHLLSVTGLGPIESPYGSNASIYGPSLSPPYGKFQFAPGQLVSYAGDPFEFVYLKAE